jgi:hypothetical protein
LLPFFSFEGLFEPDGGLISLRVRDSKRRGGSSRRSSSVGRLGRSPEAEESRAMVRRLVNEVIDEGNVDALDELLVPGEACLRRLYTGWF